MLLAINGVGVGILLAVDLAALGPSQLAAIGCTVIVDFMIDGRFAAFEVSGFSGGQLAALHSLSDALLLIALALSHFALGVSVLYASIVLVPVDIFGDRVLLLMQR